jgi:hypothetical protein
MLRKVIRVLSVKSVAFDFVACQKNKMLQGEHRKELPLYSCDSSRLIVFASDQRICRIPGRQISDLEFSAVEFSLFHFATSFSWWSS